MANIKSAKKRILVSRTRAARNKAVRTGVKTAIKKVDAAIIAGDKAAAQAQLQAAISRIVKAETNRAAKSRFLVIFLSFIICICSLL